MARPSRAARRTTLLRGVTAAGAGLLLASLWLRWGADNSVQPPLPLDAWAALERTDVLLALAGIAVVAGAALPRARAGGALALGAGLVALVLAVRAAGRGAAGGGLDLATVAAAGAAAAGALRLAGARAERWRADPRVRRVVRALLRSWVLGPLIALSTWPVDTLAPQGGDDGSFIVALHLAALQGLDFGEDLIYTYGPLGWLTFPRLIDAGQVAAGLFYVGAVHVALATALLATARRGLPLALALIATVLALDLHRLAAPDEMTQPAVLVLLVLAGVWLLRDEGWARRRWWPLVPVACGAAAGAHLLVKLNTGGVGAVLALVIAGFAPPRELRWRSLALCAGALCASLIVAWLVAGQPLGALPDYLTQSWQVVSGYAESFGDEDGQRRWEYLMLPLVALAVGVAAWTATDGMPRVRRAGLMLLVAVYLFGAFKQGFVRHAGYAPTFFVACLFAALALSTRARGVAMATLIPAVLLVAAFASLRPEPRSVHETRAAIAALRDQVVTVGEAGRHIDAARRAIRDAEAIPPAAVRLLAGRRTHVLPGEAAVAFGYPEIRWSPLPAFQSLVSYTRSLSEANRDRLIAPDGPERVLRNPELTPFRDAAVWPALLCRFESLHTSDRWQVLGRTPDRCGPLQSVARVPARVGQTVEVPPIDAGAAVLVAVHGIGLTLPERVQTLLWKAYNRILVINDQATHRIAIDLAETPTLIRVPAAVDARPPYAFSLGATTVRVELATDGILTPARSLPRSIELEFFALPVRP